MERFPTASSSRGSANRSDPSGSLRPSLVVPAKHATSLCFGGPRLRRLFVTTDGIRPRKPQSHATPEARFSHAPTTFVALRSPSRGSAPCPGAVLPIPDRL
ncbi:SMP-30/gluconolactonase/LRE family protein [Ensifer sp. LC499]|uniref:SMP-30/gluconolactonase/LRE family protein n=1 Tax=Ensifer sp. LC499 TaxID=1120654 RepID=UPI00387E918E